MQVAASLVDAKSLARKAAKLALRSLSAEQKKAESEARFMPSDNEDTY